MVYFTSDLHLGHKNIIKHRPVFKTLEEHDNYIIDKILSLGKRDVLMVLGDFMFESPNFNEYIERLKNKKCRIKLIFGNHDSLKLLNYPELFEVQLPLYSYKNYWVSHCPIHPDELRRRYGCIHGHLHLSKVQKYIPEGYTFRKELDNRYFNVNIDVNEYDFVNFEEIKKYFNK